ncbi:hypothetical protein UFOVP51_66 [uncultured Caudovirales phage]|uniref:Uncharacterized protein n=1 Tax=uncultured Caudovirales phage TaxID=2100421 RepID=A0A6J5KPA8_9CAUD|nr:hypothetical protein UFOVP51_66 [uncultured Caudovirales phage]CAB4240899.1 hypothetical protein UFOVP34_40 [uncultured Caudovirales phage]
MPMSTITVAGVNPGLNILGATQQFNYTQSLSAFQITNSFIPSISISSQFNQEFRNNLLSGFRLSHITTNTDTYGSLTLQSFVNAQTTGSDIIKFDNGGINILTTLNLNNLSGTSGQVLTSQGAGNAPIWTTNGSGTVTSITAGAGLSGGTITSSGTIDITNTSVTPATYNGSFTVNSRGQLTAANNKPLASLYMDGNNTATTIVTPGTFTKILGTTTAGTLSDFTSPSNNRLTYGGTDTIDTIVRVDLSAAPILSSTIGIIIKKNNTTFIPAANYTYQMAGGKPISLTVSVPIQFATSDYVEVFITSDAIAGDNITVSYMNLSVVI